MNKSTRLPAYYTYRSCSTMKTVASKLPVHSFYAPEEERWDFYAPII